MTFRNLVIAFFVCAFLVLCIVFAQHKPQTEEVSENTGTILNTTFVNTEKSALTISQRDSKLALAAFGRLKELAGDWTGKGVSGMIDNSNFRMTAGGSAIEHRSFVGEPDESLTVFYLDQDRLMLTHFCSTKKQLRLVATSFENDGTKIIFTFLDGTNFKSKEEGHMEKLVLGFVDKDKFSMRWSWRLEGKESWLEEFIFTKSQTSGKERSGVNQKEILRHKADGSDRSSDEEEECSRHHQTTGGAYLPKERILFEADLFDEVASWQSTTTIQLAKWIESQKLTVETIFPVHRAVTKFEDFQKDAANFMKVQN